MRIMHLNRAALMFYKFLIPVIEAQKKGGHYVCICTADEPEVEQLRNRGIDVFTHGLKRSLTPLNILKAILRTRKILVEQQIDVLICHSPFGAGVGRLAARLAKTRRVVYFAHGLACTPAQGVLSWRLRYWVEKLLGFITDAVLVMNDYDEKLSRKRHIIKDTNKIFRIPGMGVDLTQYSLEGSLQAKDKLARELSIDGHKKIVLFVGRLIPEKGVFVLLEAAKRVFAQRDDVCFLLAGGGPSMDEIRKIVEINHLEANFKLLGWRNDVYRLMKAADIFTLPTYYNEGLPVSILEAMACGKPVVATQHRGCEDVVVDGETGFLVPVKQAAPLAGKISILLDNSQLRSGMGQAGRQHVEQHFELDHCTREIVNALEMACQ